MINERSQNIESKRLGDGYELHKWLRENDVIVLDIKPLVMGLGVVYYVFYKKG